MAELVVGVTLIVLGGLGVIVTWQAIVCISREEDQPEPDGWDDDLGHEYGLW